VRDRNLPATKSPLLKSPLPDKFLQLGEPARLPAY